MGNWEDFSVEIQRILLRYANKITLHGEMQYTLMNDFLAKYTLQNDLYALAGLLSALLDLDLN